MNETIIQEIANQLGMAVDQAGKFIAEHLPDYAALKCMQCYVPITILASLTLLVVVASLASLAFFLRAYRTEKAKGKDSSFYSGYRGCVCEDKFKSFWVFTWTGITAIVLIIALAVKLSCIVPEIIGWQSYPDAMLIDKAINAIGK